MLIGLVTGSHQMLTGPMPGSLPIEIDHTIIGLLPLSGQVVAITDPARILRTVRHVVIQVADQATHHQGPVHHQGLDQDHLVAGVPQEERIR